MTRFEHDTVVPYKQSTLSKKKQVESMFDDIAYRYDFLNRFLSAGIDVIWRKKALNQLKSLSPQKLLDVATGTADIAIMASEILHPLEIVGIDISDGMLEIGRKKINKLELDKTISLINGDSEALPFSNESFDAVTVAFGVRNFQNLEAGLKEIQRVLKPGGKLVVLEFSKPNNIMVKGIYSFYMKIITPTFGKLFSKNKQAYAYLDASIQKFPEGKFFMEVLNRCDFKSIYQKKIKFRNMQYLLRNKIIAFCIGTLFLLPNITQGQRYLDLNLLDHDEKKFHFGIKLGVNKSFYHFYNSNTLLDFKDILSVQSIQNTGINLGWLVNMRLGEFFDLRTYPIDLIFTEKSFLYSLKNNTDTLKKIQGISLALPLQIKFCSERIDNIKVYLMAGGKMEYDFAANNSSNSGKLSERQQVKLKKMDYGIEAGIGFHLYFPVFVLTPEIKASWGLRDMHIRDNDLKYSNVIDRISSRVYSISLVIE